MQDPTETDRQEILSGPGDTRLATRNRRSENRATKKSQKTLFIVASALVAVLAAGGVGYMLAANPGETAQQGGRPAPAQSTGGADDLQGDDATMGDAATDAPTDGRPAADDGSMGDVADPGSGGDPAADTGTDTARTGTDTAKTGNGKKPATTPPTKVPQSSGNDTPADSPADGPGGMVNGQCATSGC
ncbi:hypothetical protein [Nonomuraea insulae]|uniref:Uncharacterized protein n=1 Tax=Nonomuraea insulae TaxID=1616787 RepID=A0ABW1CKS3_9ACTN